MIAKDFIIQIRDDLQEKSEHWKDENLFVKLQRSYISLQFDLPCFMSSEIINIQEGKNEYYIKYIPLKNISLETEDANYNYVDIEHFGFYKDKKIYTLNQNQLLISQSPRDTTALLKYKYQKELLNMNCEIELPAIYHKALRYLLMSEIHEKPTRNTKDRNLNTHYIKLYDKETQKLQTQQKIRAKNITSNYQRI